MLIRQVVENGTVRLAAESWGFEPLGILGERLCLAVSLGGQQSKTSKGMNFLAIETY